MVNMLDFFKTFSEDCRFMRKSYARMQDLVSGNIGVEEASDPRKQHERFRGQSSQEVFAGRAGGIRAVRGLVLHIIPLLPVVSRGFIVQVYSTTIPPKGTPDRDGQIGNSSQLIAYSMLTRALKVTKLVQDGLHNVDFIGLGRDAGYSGAGM